MEDNNRPCNYCKKCACCFDACFGYPCTPELDFPAPDREKLEETGEDGFYERPRVAFNVIIGY